MIRLNIDRLVLNCKSSIESIDFSQQLTFMHGETATGKSTIARLIDFCFGGDFEYTPALEQELVSVELYLTTNQYKAIIRRDAKSSKQVQVTWTNEEGVTESRLVPLVKTDVPVLEDIFNLSDLLLFLLQLPNVKVPAEFADHVSTARLSIRDIMWYCYLRQDLVDSNFFNLDENAESNRRRKSRFVFKYILGLYTERVSELETKLAINEDQRKKRSQEISNIKRFLSQFGYDSERQLNDELKTIEEELNKSKTTYQHLRDGFTTDTHFVDHLREELVNLEKRIFEDGKALEVLSEKSMSKKP